ncbi:recombinase RecF [bacterium]|nr:MAG: recombinase RecF [bacterium]
MVKIKKVKILGIGPILDLEIEFNDHFNIICGQNGVGKTTILDCLSQSFAGSSSSLKKTAALERGSWTVDVLINGLTAQKTFDTVLFIPTNTSRNRNGFYENSNDIIVFKTQRDIPYVNLNNLSKDSAKEIHQFASETIGGSLSTNLKNWFVNRYLFSAQPKGLNDNQRKNYELAKKCFNILNPEVSFSRVLVSSFDIMLNTENGEIYFEYLSSGYKSCLAVLLGLINELELRYTDPSKYIKDFDGIVFIDEIDLHLHPEWQAKMYWTLKEILPNAQLFISTHSPHILQVAQPREIIPLILDDNRRIKINPIVNQEFGLQGWTVEEVLKDVMGMSETRSDTYLDIIANCNKALDEENYKEAKTIIDILDRMLHPENSLRKILKIQLAGLSDDD